MERVRGCSAPAGRPRGWLRRRGSFRLLAGREWIRRAPARGRGCARARAGSRPGAGSPPAGAGRAAAGQVVEAEAEFRFFDPVLDVGLVAVPALELVGGALLVVGDEHPVVPLAPFERQLLSLRDRVAADDEAPLPLPGLRLPDDARDLTAGAVARRLPVGLGDLPDPRPHRGEQWRPDRIGDLALLERGEEVLAVEALVGAQADVGFGGDTVEALGQEALGARRGGGVPVAQLRVQPLAGLRHEAQQRMPGDLAGVGAARALAGAGRAVVLDQRRVEVERDRLPVEQRVDTSKELIESTVELADVAETEARQEAAERRRVGHRVATKPLLGRVATKQRRVVETLSPGDQRLAERQRLLRGRITTPALLDGDRVE